MDLGLTDEDIAGLQAKSDMDASGSTEWEEFLPIGCELIRGGGLSRTGSGWVGVGGEGGGGGKYPN